KSKR
ncbi:hypothetical protein D046_0640C, partial [Vibrio parahaemolyticus V-223/04]